MHGEILSEARLIDDGLAGDRLYAYASDKAPPGMLRVSGAERRALLRFRAEGNEVLTPSGETFPIDSPALLGSMREYLGSPSLRLTRNLTPQTDVRPLSLISLQTIRLLSEELGKVLDPRRFRANLILDMAAAEPRAEFPEDGLVGRTLQIGAVATIRILERDPRCRFITYDPDAPDTEEPEIGLMKLLHRRHDSRAGVYAAVLTPGPIRTGDAIQPAG